MRNRSNVFLAIFLVLFGLGFIGLKLWQFKWGETIITLDEKTELSVLVARNQYQWHRGLGGRESLEEFDGMLFIFPEAAQHGMVMRDMQFPIDILWIANGEIIDMVTDVQPEPHLPEEDLARYYPRYDATAVLELPAGQAKSYGVVLGDPVKLL